MSAHRMDIILLSICGYFIVTRVMAMPKALTLLLLLSLTSRVALEGSKYFDHLVKSTRKKTAVFKTR